MQPSRLIGSAPIFLVSDIDRSVAYYRDRVGFTVNGIWGEPPSFAILERDGFCLMLSLADSAEAIRPHYRFVDSMWNAYFWVDDADALYQELLDRGAKIDYEPCLQPYGCREFGIQDPDGYDVAFGQDVSPAATADAEPDDVR